MLVTPAHLAELLLSRVGRAPPVSSNEAELQVYLHAHLSALFPGATVLREYVLSKGCRPDFAIPTDAGLLVVEVKVKGSASEVEVQLRRYALHERVCGVVLVTTRACHTMPTIIEGKPVSVAALAMYL